MASHFYFVFVERREAFYAFSVLHLLFPPQIYYLNSKFILKLFLPCIYYKIAACAALECTLAVAANLRDVFRSRAQEHAESTLLSLRNPTLNTLLSNQNRSTMFLPSLRLTNFHIATSACREPEIPNSRACYKRIGLTSTGVKKVRYVERNIDRKLTSSWRNAAAR